MGSPAYMSPEPHRGEIDAIGPSTDVYGLGAVLYELLTGRPPNVNPDDPNADASSVSFDPPRPRQVNPDVPVPLEKICLRALALAPSERYLSAAAFAADVLAYLDRPKKLAFVGSGFATLGIVAFFATRKESPTEFEPSTSSHPKTIAAAPNPLKVEKLEVRPHKYLGTDNLGKDNFQPLHVLGSEDSYTASVNDAINVKVQFNRPAFCYVILFCADGQDHLLYPPTVDDIPSRTDQPNYPSESKGDALYSLDEGVGLWVVAIVTSDEPLTSYREWRQRNLGGPWKQYQAQANTVVFNDGRSFDVFVQGQPRTRGNRGEKVNASLTPFVTLVDWLKHQSGATVAALGFPVKPHR